MFENVSFLYRCDFVLLYCFFPTVVLWLVFVVDCGTGDVAGMLEYTFKLCNTVVASRDFRRDVLRELVDIYRGLAVPDYVSMCQCFLYLDDPQSVATLLTTLLQDKDLKKSLEAYQVAFDLHENQNQPFFNRVVTALPPAVAVAAAPTAAAATGTSAMEVEMTATISDDSYEARVAKLKSIFSGEIPMGLYLHFLYKHNKTDLNILKQIKDKLEARNAVTHNATVMAHAIMHAGTTVDTFLRDNLEWLGKAQHWAKYSATATIGIIHKGHHKESLTVLAPYLPTAGQQGSSFQEGGAMYALGLIHTNHGFGETADKSKTKFLLDALHNAGTNEVVQHGACMGIGLTSLASGSQSVYEAMKNVSSLGLSLLVVRPLSHRSMVVEYPWSLSMCLFFFSFSVYRLSLLTVQ